MELEIKDLRLGIYLYDSLRKISFEMQLKHFRELDICQKSFLSRYKPIQIFSEQLDRLHFEKKKGSLGEYYVSPHDDTVRVYLNNGRYWIGFVSEGPYNFSTIASFTEVHKLQNFYYELVGEELTIYKES